MMESQPDKFNHFRLWLVISLLALMFAASAEAQTMLTWIAPTTDEAGIDIPPDVNLNYRLYSRVDKNGRKFEFQSEHDESPLDISDALSGCYETYVTAIRMDTNPPLESAPSNTAKICVNLDCGVIGTDGSVGACEGDSDIPVPTEGQDPELQLLAPSAPVGLSTEISL
jgi:hypothetical protein